MKHYLRHLFSNGAISGRHLPPSVLSQQEAVRRYSQRFFSTSFHSIMTTTTSSSSSSSSSSLSLSATASTGRPCGRYHFSSSTDSSDSAGSPQSPTTKKEKQQQQKQQKADSPKKGPTTSSRVATMEKPAPKGGAGQTDLSPSQRSNAKPPGGAAAAAKKSREPAAKPPTIPLKRVILTRSPELGTKERKQLESRGFTDKYRDLVEHYFGTRMMLTRLDKPPQQLAKEWKLALAFDRLQAVEWEKQRAEAARRKKLRKEALGRG